MVVVKNVRDFAVQNEEDLKRFMRFKTGIYDEDIIRDTIQEFYVKLIETRALDKFNVDRVSYGSVEALFDTFICNLFCWLLPIMARRNHRARYDFFFRVVCGCAYMGQPDVWEHLGEHSMMYRVNELYHAAHVSQTEEEEIDRRLDEFIEYLKRYEESPKKVRRMEIYLRHRNDGCSGVEIAGMLSVSNNMVKLIKKDLRAKFDAWEKGEEYDA
jgi:hypothetical protein